MTSLISGMMFTLYRLWGRGEVEWVGLAVVAALHGVQGDAIWMDTDAMGRAEFVTDGKQVSTKEHQGQDSLALQHPLSFCTD